ncbi:MAG: PorP/SprF family type IX secretion system membrane protein [Bacteroides sp.]|nr:PorP/SprF family type IX secretion system membrane protein [Bacteroides sp.]MCM1378505.1 PorP/SprF family type IX secretion system membrane protein [Bacteroides sp.]MCM1444806.1 PorP/SprF family type IX secretion system membrane protein [Prevotella sp.]
MNKIFKYLLLLIAFSASAQTEPNMTQYFQAPSFINPAEAGATDLLRIRGGFRMQWLGIEGAPRDFMAAADVPFQVFGRRFGGGVTMFQESIGLYKTFSINGQLSARQKIGKGYMTLGVQFGYLTQSFKGSEVEIPDDDDYHDSNDEAIPTMDVEGNHFDMAVGLGYTHKWFSVGVACTHLLSPKIKMQREGEQGGGSSDEQYFEFNFRRNLYFIASSNIPLKNTLFEVLPSVMVRSDLRSVQADITARLRWKKFLTAGLGYRTNDAVSVMLEGEFKGIKIGYSYDYSTSAIMRASSGSHEVWLGYSLKLNFGEKNRNKHKSIRVM